MMLFDHVNIGINLNTVHTAQTYTRGSTFKLVKNRFTTVFFCVLHSEYIDRT